MMLSKISEALANLSGAERKVAECALAEPKWFVHAAVAEIAEHASVSQPTVIRFCRSLGYKGLPEFKLSLSASIGHEGMPYVHEELNADDDMGGVMEKVLGNTAASILGARRSLKETDLENAIAMLSHARRNEFYGVATVEIAKRLPQKDLLKLTDYLRKKKGKWHQCLLDWLVAASLTGLRPQEWSGSSISDIDGEPALQAPNAKNTSNGTPLVGNLAGSMVSRLAHSAEATP